MGPDLDAAIFDVINYYGWKNIIYLYYSHEGKEKFMNAERPTCNTCVIMATSCLAGLLRLKSIFQGLAFTNDSLRVSVVKRIASPPDAISILRNIEMSNRFIF